MIKNKGGNRWGQVAIVFLLLTLVSQASVYAESSETNQGWMEWGNAYWPTGPVSGGVIRVAAPFYIGVMNPNHFPVMDWITMGYMYEKLVNHDAQYKPTSPWLAESWEYLDDVNVRMKLKQGVIFHDGSAFNAESLKYQIEWILDKQNGAWTRSWLEPVESLKIEDEYTLIWHFKRPWGAFLGTMASVPGFAISAVALEKDRALTETKRLKRRLTSLERKTTKAEKKAKKNGNDEDHQKALAARKELEDTKSGIAELVLLAKDAKPLDANPVGTGQYMIERNNPGNYIKLKRNPNWWFGKSIGMPDMPYFDGSKVSVIPDPSVRLASLKAGELDYVVLNPFQYRLVEKDPRLNTRIEALNWLVWLMLNQTEGPCKDIRVRKAISHAIDRKALIMGTQSGLGREASCIFPDRHWAKNPTLKPVSYDPELAKKLLAEAGFSDGLTLRGMTANTPESQSFAKAVMAMLEKVGIRWDVKFVGIAAMADPFVKRDYDMAGGLFQWIFEPDLIATALYMPDGVLNYGRNNHPEVIRLIKAGRQEIDDAARTRIYNQLEQVLYDNYMDIYLWYPSVVYAINKNIQGFNEKMYQEYGEAYIWPHPMWFKDGHP
jgi:peptide/nickel transport system substrate-binding protein